MKKMAFEQFKNSVITKDGLKKIIGGSRSCCLGGSCIDCSTGSCELNKRTNCMGCSSSTANTCNKNSNFSDDDSMI
jgi:hypothetical protein